MVLVRRVVICALALAALFAPARADYATTAKAVLPGVVTVRAFLPPSQVVPELFEQYLPPSYDDGGERKAAGTGFVFDAAQGLIVTAAYVVDGAASIEVQLSDGTVREAAIAAADDASGVALLKVAPGGLTALQWTDRAAAPGESVLLVAHAFGKGPFVTSGIVSGYDLADDLSEYRAMWMDILVGEGAAGAPIISADGRVAGMAFGRYGPASAGARQAFGIAVPAADILPIVRELAAKGKIARSAVGVTIAKSRYRRVAIIDVFDGSPAKKAGLKKDDEVVAVDNVPIYEEYELRRHVARAPVGSTLRFTVLRDGEERGIDVVTEEKAEPY